MTNEEATRALRSPIGSDKAECRKRPSWWWFAWPTEEDGPADSRPEAKAANRSAKDICATCPLLTDCAVWGLKNETHGVWGALDPHDRYVLGGKGRAPKRPVPKSVVIQQFTQRLLGKGKRAAPVLERIAEVVGASDWAA